MSAPQRGTPGTWAWLGFWDGPDLRLAMTMAALPASDLDAGDLILEETGGGIHYATGTKTWYIWDGRCHRPDDSALIERRVADFGRRIRELCSYARQLVYTEVSARLPADVHENKLRDEFNKAWAPWSTAEKYGSSLARNAGLRALVAYLGSLAGCTDEEMAEREPGLLNVANGTLDLASLALSPHRQDDMITYVLPDRWNPTAKAPRFWDLLWRVGNKDTETMLYLLKVLGYCLLGDNREQKIIFIAGPAGSGKSVLLHLVSEVLGPLAHASGAELITVVHQGRNARKENSIRGVRLVTITETSKFMTIDEGQLKRITGEPVISVDQHYAKTELKTPVTWTIFVATNDMPNLVNFDAAMRRRVIVIPGGPGMAEWEMDASLAVKILSAEREGILALLAKGCAEYFRSGLAMTAEVAKTTELFAHEQNTVEQFIADTMAIGGWGTGIPQHDAWEGYERWARGGPHLGRTKFMEHMKATSGIGYNESSRRFAGVAWNSEWQSRVGL